MPDTKEPVKVFRGWAVFDAAGEYVPRTIRDDEATSKSEACYWLAKWITDDDGYTIRQIRMWDALRREGYECRRVAVSVVPEEKARSR